MIEPENEVIVASTTVYVNLPRIVVKRAIGTYIEYPAKVAITKIVLMIPKRN
jgi:hypothetical protein